MIKIGLLLIYLLLGAHIFVAGVDAYGGVEEYKKQLDNEAQYILAAVLVTILWPYFVIKSIFTK